MHEHLLDARQRRGESHARRQRRAKVVAWTLALASLALGLTALGIAIHAYTSSTRQVTVTVQNEARVCSNDGNGVSCQYLIYTSGGTFKDTDSLIAGKFSSSDLYGQLQNGHTYTLEVRGYRIPWMSEYPNILRIVSGS